MSRTKGLMVAGGVFALACGPGAAHATENGAIAYPIGVNTIMAGAMPDLGETWYQNYAVYYTTRAFTDGQGNGSVPGFSANVAVNAGRLFHTWDVDLGPFRLASGIVVPVLNSNVSTVFGSQSEFGFGDITLQPIDIGWSNAERTLFGYAALDVFVPTGGPTSNNFYTLNPHLIFTWLPLPTLDISGAIGVEFHRRNDDTGYRSGTLFFMDWGVNWHAFEKLPGLAVGLGGYFIKQLSDDELNGVMYLDGFRQQGFAIGPQISYGGPSGAIGVKWQHEFATENRPQGERFWLQFMLPLKAP